MLRSLFLMVLALWAGSASASPRITSYQASCNACGEDKVEMGSHSFCALSSVNSGRLNSTCTVMNSQNSWRLTAMSRPGGGESIFCAAVCMDLDDQTSSPPVSRPVSPRENPGLGTAPESFGPYQSDFGALTLRRSGNQMTGTYTHKDGRVEGTLNGNTLTGRWTQSNGEGRMVFQFNADYSGFTGVWSYGNATPDRPWNGRR